MTNRRLARGIVAALVAALVAGVATWPLAAQRANAPILGAAKGQGDARAGVRPESLSTLSGTITDSSGRPVGFATVASDSGQTTIALQDGSFRLGKIIPGASGFLVRRIGYQPLAFEIEMPAASTVSVHLKLLPVVQDLKAVIIEGKRVSPALARTGFYERQRQGLHGIFFDEEYIKRRNVIQTTDLFQGQPSVYVSRAGAFRKMWGRGLRCPMDVFVDGVALGDGFDLERNMPPEWIKAIEIYPAANGVPPQFQRNIGCGAIVVWTKVD